MVGVYILKIIMLKDIIINLPSKYSSSCQTYLIPPFLPFLEAVLKVILYSWPSDVWWGQWACCLPSRADMGLGARCGVFLSSSASESALCDPGCPWPSQCPQIQDIRQPGQHTKDIKEDMKNCLGSDNDSRMRVLEVCLRELMVGCLTIINFKTLNTHSAFRLHHMCSLRDSKGFVCISLKLKVYFVW